MILFTLLAMNTLYAFSMFSTRPVIPIYAEELGVSPLTIGMLVSSYSFLPMLLAIRAGRWVDRFGSRKMVFFGGGGLLLAFLLPFLSPRLPALFVSQLLFGFSQLFVVLSIQKTVGNLPGNRDKLITAHSLSAAFGDMLGPLAGGFLFAHYGFRPVFAMAVASAAAATALGLLLRARHWQGGVSAAREAYPYSGSAWGLLQNVNLRKAVLISGIGLYSKELIVAYFPLYGTKMGMTAGEIGVVLSISALMTIIVRFVQYPLVQRFGRTRLMTVTLFLGAAAYAAIPATGSPALLTVIIAFMGASLGIGQPLTMVYALNHTPSARHGEVLGLRLSANRILQFSAPIAFGGVAGAFGLSSIFVVNGVLMAAGAFFTRIRAVPAGAADGAPKAGAGAMGGDAMGGCAVGAGAARGDAEEAASAPSPAAAGALSARPASAAAGVATAAEASAAGKEAAVPALPAADARRR